MPRAGGRTAARRSRSRAPHRRDAASIVFVSAATASPVRLVRRHGGVRREVLVHRDRVADPHVGARSRTLLVLVDQADGNDPEAHRAASVRPSAIRAAPVRTGRRCASSLACPSGKIPIAPPSRRCAKHAANVSTLRRGAASGRLDDPARDGPGSRRRARAAAGAEGCGTARPSRGSGRAGGRWRPAARDRRIPRGGSRRAGPDRVRGIRSRPVTSTAAEPALGRRPAISRTSRSAIRRMAAWSHLGHLYDVAMSKPDRLRALGGVLGPVAFTAAWLLAQRRQDEYQVRHEHISGLAARDATDPHVMTAGFVALGGCTMLFASALERRLGPRAGVGPALIGVAGLATIAAGVFRRDRRSNFPPPGEPEGQSWVNDVHDAAAVLSGMAGHGSAWSRSRRRWRGIRRSGIWRGPRSAPPARASGSRRGSSATSCALGTACSSVPTSRSRWRSWPGCRSVCSGTPNGAPQSLRPGRSSPPPLGCARRPPRSRRRARRPNRTSPRRGAVPRTRS